MPCFCTRCGANLDPQSKFCSRCGAPVPAPAPGQVPGQAPGQAAGRVPGQVPGQVPGRVPGQAPGQAPGRVPGYAPGSIPGYVPGRAPVPVPTPMPAPMPTPVSKALPKQKKEKKGKKKRGRGFLKFLLVVVIVAAIVAALWFSVGNYITLKIHTHKVLEALNSGNLELSQFQSDPYEELPLYVLEMMGRPDEPEEIGPIVSAMIPYLSFEITKINGFFGNSEVEYCVVSRDIGSWLLSLDYSTITSTEQLQQMILDYIPEAPVKEYSVTIQYYRDGVFGWKGNYEIPAFADAISGGLNTAYNELYERMIKEMEELLG